MSRLMPPVAMAPGNSRARSARPRVHQPIHRVAPRTEALRPADVGLGQLFVHTRDAIVVGNVDSGRIVLWNPAAEHLFGYTADEAFGQPISMLIPPAIARLHHASLALYRRTGEGAVLASRAPVEVSALSKSGVEIRVELSLVALDHANGDKQYVMAMLRDATDRRRAELQALEAARAHSARAEAVHLLADQAQLLTHSLAELARPVARLERSAARLARLADPSPMQPEREQHLRRMARVVEARAQVVRHTLQHVLDGTGIQTGTLALDLERVNLVPLVARVVATARLRSSNHKFNVALPQGLTALVDAGRFAQVIDALIGQAMHRNPRGCYIDIDLRRPLVGLAQLEVRDYGRAVSAEDQQRLLDTNGPSSGLSVSRWIIEQHGGTLTLEAPPERGLRAIVTLPTQRGRLCPERDVPADR